MKPTRLLDYTHPTIETLVVRRGWRTLPPKARIGALYDFVRDEVAFGYNIDDEVPASRVLSDGMGQCNTKGILLMALLRACGVPCRFHGFTIDKALQKGAISGLWYLLSPGSIVHSWVEVEFEAAWYNLEGFILDLPYLAAIQHRFSGRTAFCGYGVATKDLATPPVYWEGNDTFIQKEGINQDWGVYADPDAFFATHRQRLGPLKRWVFRHLARHQFNRTVARIRGNTPPREDAR